MSFSIFLSTLCPNNSHNVPNLCPSSVDTLLITLIPFVLWLLLSKVNVLFWKLSYTLFLLVLLTVYQHIDFQCYCCLNVDTRSLESVAALMFRYRSVCCRLSIGIFLYVTFYTVVSYCATCKGFVD